MIKDLKARFDWESYLSELLYDQKKLLRLRLSSNLWKLHLDQFFGSLLLFSYTRSLHPSKVYWCDWIKKERLKRQASQCSSIFSQTGIKQNAKDFCNTLGLLKYWEIKKSCTWITDCMRKLSTKLLYNLDSVVTNWY